MRIIFRKESIHEKIISFLLAIIISFSFVVSGNAINNSQHQLQQTFKPFTEYWIAQCYNGNAQVNEIIPVVNGYDEVTGYSISFYQDTKPAGYVILDLNDLEDNNPIAEYTLSGEDWYTVMSRAISKSSSNHKTKTFSTHEKKLRSNTYTDFSIDVQTPEGEKVLTSAGKLETKAAYIKTAQYISDQYKKLKAKRPIEKMKFRANASDLSNFWDAWLSTAPPKTVEFNSVTGASSFVSLNMYYMPAYSGSGYAGANGEGNCGPTSETILMKYYKDCRGKNNLLRNGNVNDTYKRISQLCGYTPQSGSPLNKISSSIKDYVKEQGYSVSVNNYLFDTWGNFTGDINNNKPIILSVGGKDANGNSVGHRVVVLGYCETNTGSRYLRIANCWDTSNNRYIKFKPSELSRFNGYSVAI